MALRQAMRALVLLFMPVLLSACGARSDLSAEARPSTGRVSLPADIDIIAAGEYHTCAVRKGQVFCWGANSYGQLGDGNVNQPQPPRPAPVPGLDGAVRVSGGWYSTCAVTAGGLVSCWGDNGDGELGGGMQSGLDGGSTTIPSPVPVEGLDHVVEVSVGSGYGYACALRENGDVLCWGDNLYQELGAGPTPQVSAVPVFTLTGAVHVSAGAGHACAALASGGVTCWGTNYNGEIGDGTTGSLHAPQTQVAGIDDALRVACGWSHSCALRRGGGVKCWGSVGTEGYLGNGSTSGSATPVDVTGLDDAVDLATSGTTETCAVRRTGDVVCWGQIGTLVSASAGGTTPSPVGTPPAIRRIVVGGSDGDVHACVADDTGALFCWGRNSEGEVGDGTYQFANAPVAIQGLP